MTTGVSTKLTGQIGEKLVSAVLGTKGYYAETLESVPVQIKTSNSRTLLHSAMNKWVDIDISDEGVQTIGDSVELKHPNMIWVMVLIINHDLNTARFFIAREHHIQAAVVFQIG